MSDELKINKSTIRLSKGDITDMEVDSFVYYAREDLKLGTGFGTAISVRGGPSIQKELDKIGEIKTTEAVISEAGEMKTKWIIHAAGPKFQEENLEAKLETTIINALKAADKKGIKEIAFPPMGSGFYGVPLNVSANITLDTIKKYLSNSTTIETVIISLLDTRDYKPYHAKLISLSQ